VSRLSSRNGHTEMSPEFAARPLPLVLNIGMDTFSQYFQNYPSEDNVTDLVESVLSGTVSKAAAVGIVFKMNQLGRNMKGPDGKLISNQLILLAALVLIAINSVSEPPSGKR
jgi:hypothetical protein